MVLYILIILKSFLLPESNDLILQIQGVRESKGNLAVLVFNKESGFPSRSDVAIRRITVPARKGIMMIRVENIPTGHYAVSVLHDENGNMKMDTNLVGMPKEGFGFSGNKPLLFGPPEFRDASFEWTPDSPQVTIVLRY